MQWTPWSLGINVSLRVTVIGRIRVDDQSDCAVVFGYFGLHPTKRISIPRNCNLALYIDAEFFQCFVVGWQTVVNVHQRCGDVAAGTVCVEEWDNFRAERRLILGNSRLGKRQRFPALSRN